MQRGIAVIDRVAINVASGKMVTSSEKNLDPLEGLPVIESMEDLMVQDCSSTTVSLFRVDEKLILVDEVPEGLHRTGI